MIGVEKGREFRFRGDLYSQESTFPLVIMYFLRSRNPKTLFSSRPNEMPQHACGFDRL